MSSVLDQSLDQIVSSRKAGRRTVRRGAKTGIVGSTNASPASRPRPRATSAPLPQSTPQTSEKIIVSNLPTDVNEFQIRELFQTMIGPLRNVTLTHDAEGNSRGIASVVFVRKGDGSKAYSQYHDRLIDGTCVASRSLPWDAKDIILNKRALEDYRQNPMKIEIVLDPSKSAPPPSLAARVGNIPEASNGIVHSPGAAVRGVGGRRGAPRRGRGGKRRGDDRPVKTAEDLDAEMEDYTGSASAPAPTATA